MRMTFSCVGKMRKAFSCGENENGIRIIGNGVFTMEISVSCDVILLELGLQLSRTGQYSRNIGS